MTQVAGPQALALHLLLQRLDDGARLAVAGVVRVAHVREQQVDRFDLLAHETLHPVQLVPEVRVGRKIPHGRLSFSKFG
jgi:hypothetical protein